MEQSDSWTRVHQLVLNKIIPPEKEVKRVKKFYNKIEKDLSKRLKDAGFQAVAEAHGSIVRGTWLAEDRDVDIFLILDPKYDRSALSKVLEVAKAYVGDGWVEAYAEHPYIRAVLDGFEVEFVPCFKADPAKGIISATDRTPLHTRYVNEHLRSDQQNEVRFLKQFMRGVQVYGAEVKIGGFSGYLCELLIIHMRSFRDVLENASRWEKVEILGNNTGAKAEDLVKKFVGPLIVIDPVDPNRNVASAVSETSYWTFVAAARSFLKKQSTRFFFHEVEAIDVNSLIEMLRSREPRTLFIVIEDVDVPVPDVLWGQLHKALRAISDFVRKEGFPLLRSAVWSDESSEHIMILELGSEEIPPAVRISGPPVGMAESSERFLEAHLGVGSTLSGPWIEGKRWWVESRREHADICSLMNSALRDGGRSLGIPEKVSDDVAREKRILLNEEIASYLNEDLARFLVRFVKGRPSWLD